MTEQDPSIIDVNTAGVETLSQLPGIGPAMAERIVAARPFASLDDLQRVSGLGPVSLERLRSRLTLSEVVPAEGAEVATETAPPEEGAAPPEEEAAPAVEDTPPPQEEEPQPLAEEVPVAAKALPEETLPPEEEPAPREEPAPVTRAQAFWLAFGAGLLAFVLAIAMTLAILTVVNGGLQFADRADVADISRQMDALNRQATTLDQDLAGVRTRLDNLERLSGRLEAVEEASTQLQADVEAMGTTVDAVGELADALDEEMDELAVQVESLQEQGTRFQTFLDGLRDLLAVLFESEETK
jgi:competence ComEA-like helix-hairpin-helix protein